jgi:cobalt/nickel transport system permease protein
LETEAINKSVFFMDRVDPRLKVASLFLWSVLLAILHTIDAALMGLLGSWLLGLASGKLLSFSSIKRVLGVNVFLIFIWLFLPFSYEGGEVIGHFWGFDITREGLDLSILVSLKALAITFGAAAIIGSSSIYTMLIGARALGVPEKIIAMLLLMNRYIQVVGDEYGRLRNAMRIRGFVPKLSKHTLKSVANLCGMLLVRGFERGDRVLAAMLCRGYKGRFWLRPNLSFKSIDVVFLLFMCLLILLVELNDVAPSPY